MPEIVLEGENDQQSSDPGTIRNETVQVSRKAWIARIFIVAALTFFMFYNLTVALLMWDPLIVYSTLMPLHTLIVFVVGWVFFKNRAVGKVPKDLVSVIIPAYNQAELIEDVINAVLKSTYSNIEVLAVDDGSKDETGKILTPSPKGTLSLRLSINQTGVSGLQLQPVFTLLTANILCLSIQTVL